jgi:hypothetical protein
VSEVVDTAHQRHPIQTAQFSAFGYPFQCQSPTKVATERLGRLYSPFGAEGAGVRTAFRLERRMAAFATEWNVLADNEVVDSCPSLGAALRALEYAICCKVVEHRSDVVVLHGATVLTKTGAAFIAGPSGAGKTTLSLALATRGFSVGGDDLAFLDPATGLLWPVPRCFHLDDRSLRLLRVAGLRLPPRPSRFGFVTPADLGRGTATPRPVRHIILLSGRRGRTPTLKVVPQAEVVAKLQAEAGWGTLSPSVCLAALGSMVGAANSWELRPGPLAAMTDLVARVVGEEVAA